MKPVCAALAALFLLLVAAGCHSRQASLTASDPDVSGPNGSRSGDEPGIPGMYVGKLPCADCSGILRHVTLFPDGVVAATSLYEGTNATFTDRGTWTMKDGLIMVSYGGEREYYSLKAPGVIALVDAQGRESTTMPNLYLLRKIPPLTAEAFAGRYTALKKDAPDQELDIRGRSARDVDVTFICGKAAKQRAFTQAGIVLNDQVEIHLPDSRAPGAIMVIRPGTKAGEIRLSTTRNEDPGALAPLCDGISPAGKYQKLPPQD